MACALIMILDRAHDKIHIFGFSRGAYTARALAGMYASYFISVDSFFY